MSKNKQDSKEVDQKLKQIKTKMDELSNKKEDSSKTEERIKVINIRIDEIGKKMG